MIYNVHDALVGGRGLLTQKVLPKEKIFIFYMNTLAWLQKHNYTKLKLEEGFFSNYAKIEYL